MHSKTPLLTAQSSNPPVSDETIEEYKYLRSWKAHSEEQVLGSRAQGVAAALGGRSQPFLRSPCVCFYQHLPYYQIFVLPKAQNALQPVNTAGNLLTFLLWISTFCVPDLYLGKGTWIQKLLRIEVFPHEILGLSLLQG